MNLCFLRIRNVLNVVSEITCRNNNYVRDGWCCRSDLGRGPHVGPRVNPLLALLRRAAAAHASRTSQLWAGSGTPRCDTGSRNGARRRRRTPSLLLSVQLNAGEEASRRELRRVPHAARRSLLPGTAGSAAPAGPLLAWSQAGPSTGTC